MIFYQIHQTRSHLLQYFLPNNLLPRHLTILLSEQSPCGKNTRNFDYRCVPEGLWLVGIETTLFICIVEMDEIFPYPDKDLELCLGQVEH